MSKKTHSKKGRFNYSLQDVVKQIEEASADQAKATDLKHIEPQFRDIAHYSPAARKLIEEAEKELDLTKVACFKDLTSMYNRLLIEAHVFAGIPALIQAVEVKRKILSDFAQRWKESLQDQIRDEFELKFNQFLQSMAQMVSGAKSLKQLQEDFKIMVGTYAPRSED